MKIQYKMPSKSSPGKFYTITNADGVWSCGCLGWTRHVPRKDCTHIKAKKAELGIAPVALDAAEIAKKVLAAVEQPVLMADKPVVTDYIPELLERVELAEAIRLLKSGLYILQEKMNGYRLQVRKTGKVVKGYNKKGKEKDVPPAVAAALMKLPGDYFMEGELVNGAYVPNDLLEQDGKSIASQPYVERFAALVAFVKKSPHIIANPSWDPTDGMTAMLRQFMRLYDDRCEGAVLKLKAAPHKAGRNGQHKKVKFWKMGSFVVLQVRPEGKESIEIGLYDGKKLISVGRCTTIGKQKAKGAKVGDVVEIRYLYATADKQVYSTEFVEVRDDVDAAECTVKAQLIFEKNVA